MDPRLLITTIGYSLGILLTIALGLFVLIKSKRNPLSIIFCFISLSIALVEISIVGVITAHTPEQAYSISFLNIFNIYIVVFTFHWVLEAIGKVQKRKWALIIVYGIAVIMTCVFILCPQTFLLTPIPKMYFNYYFVPGILYSWMRIYFVIVTVYFLYELFTAYRATIDTVVRNRLKFVFAGILFGMIFGHYALFLVYNIEIDPIWSVLFPLYTIPLAYSIIKYELMDVKIIAKRALLFALTISLVTVLLNIINSSNQFLIQNYPLIPEWLLPLIISFIGSSIGFVIWLRIKEADVLKFEFITIVSHKFRTPLTHIKWAVDSLKNEAEKSKEVKEGLESISIAGESLIELTNTLMQATNAEQTLSSSILKKENLIELIQNVLNKYKKEIEKRSLTVSFTNTGTIPLVAVTASSFKLIMQSLIENAVTYNKNGGKIDIKASYVRDEIIITVQDTGIGISHIDQSRIFSKFYRGKASVHIDTEGLGLSLFVARQIALRNGWILKIFSEGEGRGTTFTLTLPTPLT